MPTLSKSSVVLSATLLSAAGAAQAGVIDSASFFTSVPHTLIDFETDQNGDPLSLIEGQSQAMPLNAYAPQGLNFVTAVNWVNDASGAFDAAQTIGGSLDHAIPSASVNTFAFTFSVPVRAFGFWVVNNVQRDPDGPIFRAYDASNTLIESVQFNGSLVDGTVTDGVTAASYGFMGLSSNVNIARVEVVKVAAIFDDLRFSATVPAPAGAGLMLGAAALASRRRQR